MKSKSFYRLLMAAIVTVILLAILHTASSFSVRVATDFWKQLGISLTQGNDKIKNSFVSGYLQFYGLRNVKNIALDQRADIAKNLLAYTKSYVNGAEFKNFYARQRADFKPMEPTKTIRSKEEIRRALIADYEKSIRESEKVMGTVDADLKKIFQENIVSAKKQIEDLKKPDNQVVEIMHQGEISNQRYEQERYRKDLAKWETDYPADPNGLVKKRLQRYLDIAATVDFEAKLTEKYGKMRFVNPAYESKSADWKVIYRAGKDVCDVTRQFAGEWIKEL